MHDGMMTRHHVSWHGQPRDGGQAGQARPGLHGLAGGPGPLRLVLGQAQVIMSDICDISDDDESGGAGLTA